MSMETIPSTQPSLEIGREATISTPKGQAHLSGTNPETGNVILTGPNGTFEASPGQVGEWHMSAAERTKAGEDLGTEAMDQTATTSPEVKAIAEKRREIINKVSRYLGDMATAFLKTNIYLATDGQYGEFIWSAKRMREARAKKIEVKTDDSDDFFTPVEQTRKYQSDWDYTNHRNDGDRVIVDVTNPKTGEKRQVNVSREYFAAWEAGDELPEETDSVAEDEAGATPPIEPPDAPPEPPSPEDDEFAELRRKRIASLLSETELKKVTEHQIPLEAVWAARKKGYGVDVLVKAKHNKKLAEGLRDSFDTKEFGRGEEEDATREDAFKIDVGAVREPTPGEPVPDPRVENILAGEKRRLKINEIARQILDDPAGLRMKLEEPASISMPLGLEKVPFGIGRKLGNRLLAWQIYLHERSLRPKWEQGQMHIDPLHPTEHSDDHKGYKVDAQGNLIPIKYNDGLLGRGFMNVRGILDEVQRHEESIASLRSKLSALNRHNVSVNNNETERAALAGRILRALELQEAYEHRRRTPDLYDHGQYKKALATYQTSGSKEYDPLKYGGDDLGDFRRLVGVGVRSQEDQRRFEQLLKEHPEWLRK